MFSWEKLSTLRTPKPIPSLSMIFPMNDEPNRSAGQFLASGLTLCHIPLYRYRHRYRYIYIDIDIDRLQIDYRQTNHYIYIFHIYHQILFSKSPQRYSTIVISTGTRPSHSEEPVRPMARLDVCMAGSVFYEGNLHTRCMHTQHIYIHTYIVLCIDTYLYIYIWLHVYIYMYLFTK